MRERLIFPLDVPTVGEAIELVDLLKKDVGVFKVGKQLFTHAGPDIVRRLRRRRLEVFLDLKFHDIPRTVAAASVEAARLGVLLLNVHASGGPEMMRQTARDVARACRREQRRKPKILGVTVLTSLDDADLKKVGFSTGVDRQVIRLAKLARLCGLDGVVASPLEVASIRRACGSRFLTVIPGVRPSTGDNQDQKRVLTPAQAIQRGADYLVVGSPIRNAADPRAAARAIVEDMLAGTRPR